MKRTIISRTLSCLLCMAACLSVCRSQTLPYDVEFPQYLPKSPSAYSFSKYIDYPMSLYTGVPDISVPLYEIQAVGLSIPVTLSYHASGITVSQEATAVGLGWSLNAGGMISRTVKGGDDFQEHASPNGLSKGYLELPEGKQPLSNTDYFWTTQEYCLKGDSEPDIFFYSCAGGSGKFILGKDSVPVPFSRDDHARIRMLQTNGRVKPFEMHDADGNRYLFDKMEQTLSYDATRPFHQNASGNHDMTDITEIHGYFGNPTEYVSAWHLTRIVTARGDTVSFTYSAEDYQLPVQESAVKQNLINVSGYASGTENDFGPTRVDYSCHKSVLRSFRLTGITWQDGHAEFGYTAREDIRGITGGADPMKLSSFKVYNKSGLLVKDWSFNYGYFNQTATGDNAHVSKRLRLDGLTDCLADSASYAFGYISGILPPKNSRNTDSWGYYNGKSQGADYYPSAVYDNTIYAGGDKTPNGNQMSIGTLNSVTQPTGGTTHFTYEANRYTTAPYWTTKTINGSLDIYRNGDDENYTDYSATQTDTVTLSATTIVNIQQYFEYTGASLPPSGSNRFGNTNYRVFTIKKRNADGTFTNVRYWPVPEQLVTQCSYNALPENLQLQAGTYLFTAESLTDELYCELRYSYQGKVQQPGTEVLGGGLRVKRIQGETTVDYTYEKGELMVKPVFAYLLTKRTKQSVYPYNTLSATYVMQPSESTTPMTSLKNGNIYGYGKVTERFADGTKRVTTFHNEAESETDYPFYTPEVNYYNGLPESVVTYDKQGNEARRESYTYTHTNSPETLYGFVYRNYGMAYFYSYTPEWITLVQKNRTDTFADSGNPDNASRTITVNYTYNDDLVPLTEQYVCGQDRFTSSYRYAKDFSGTAYTLMRNRNMVRCPVESLTLKNGKVVAGKRTGYGIVHGIPVSLSDSYIQTETPLTETDYGDSFESRVSYAAHNRFGLSGEVTKDTQKRAYLWSYGGQHLVAEIDNAAYTQVENALGNDFIMRLAEKDTPSEADIQTVQSLRTALPQVKVTICEYQPFVGVTGITDSRGCRVGFGYDGVGRLNAVTDKVPGSAEHLLARYAYQTAPTAFVKGETMLDSLATRFTTRVNYHDGYARPVLMADNSQSGNGRYAFSMTAYDGMSRPVEEWLPAVGDTASAYRTANEIRTLSYSTYTDSCAYGVNGYDAFGRVTSEMGPGRAWHAANRKTTTEYSTNTTNSVRRYTATSGSTVLSSTGYYNAGALVRTTVTDEDGKTRTVYIDLFGNTILERSAADNDTYYVYDDMNRLRSVLSPCASELLDTNGSWNMASDSVLLRYAYHYEYDGRGRVVSKKLPGVEKTLIRYDSDDRPVLSQNGNQRAQTSPKWSYRIYDAFNRVTESGECTDTLLTGRTAYIKNFYDNYSFLSANGFDHANGNTGLFTTDNSGYGEDRLTGSVTSVLDSDAAIYKAYYYDPKGRAVRMVSTNLLGGHEVTECDYTFTDKPSRTIHTHTASGKPSLSETYLYGYDDLDRISSLHHALGTDTVALATYGYDTLGRTASRTFHGNSANRLSYAYNVRGWLTAINGTRFSMNLHYDTGVGAPLYNGDISSYTWRTGSSTSELRGYVMAYDELGRVTSAMYGEGIRLDEYINLCTEEVNSYDRNGNILSLTRFGGSHYWPTVIDELTFTLNGNQLSRVDDDCDTEADIYGGFLDGTSQNGEYAYDANGNLIKDLNKGITSITYNTLNLPERIDFADMSRIDYTYSADGTKLRTEHYLNGQDTICTDYCEGLVYEDGIRRCLLTGVGYVTGLNTTPSYHYYLKDHQGNNRVVVNQSGNVDEENDYYPFGGLFTNTQDESRRNVQPYKYNGKEFDNRKNLNLYDYGARFYDPAIGRFTSVDTYAEKYYPMTPYQYAANNPVRNVDVDGDSIVVSIPEYTNDQPQNVDYYYSINKNGDSSFISKSGKTSSYNYILGLTQALNELMKGPTGNQLVHYLASSHKVVYFRKGNNGADSEGRYVNWNMTETEGGINQEGKTERPTYVSLGHELAHIQDAWNGTFDSSEWFENIPNSEKYASHVENLIRAEHGLSLRTHYCLTTDGRGDPRSALLIKGTRASLYFKKSVRLGNTAIPTTPYVY